MFIAVVSTDAPCGTVGIWPVAEQRPYLRNSRYHRAGDPYWKDVSCGGAFFFNLMDSEILPVCAQCGIHILPMDNARPHIIDNMETSIITIMSRHPTIRLQIQPP